MQPNGTGGVIFLKDQQDVLAQLLKTARRVHFVGIGGISMSALSEILFDRGYQVSGSDLAQSDLTEHLQQKGITVYQGHSAAQVVPGIDVVIHTAAVHADNPELIRANDLQIPVFERAVLLGVVMRDYRKAISIAGTHGKTTTTSMMCEVLLAAGCDPTCLVGGQLSAIGGNIRVGQGDYIVCEACEYVDSFLTLSHHIAAILNIEEDHLDYFSGIEQIKASFVQFAAIAGKDGLCVLNTDSPHARAITSHILPKLVTFGTDPANSPDYLASDILMREGHSTFGVLEHGQYRMEVTLQVPGLYNVQNALCVVAIARSLGIPCVAIQAGLRSFGGTRRRFERVGKLNGAQLIDDYAHHPTEIRATLTAARQICKGRVICLFQPHTYSRTEALYDEFAAALGLADVVVLAPIYPAREKNIHNVSATLIGDQVPGAVCLDSLQQVADYAARIACPGDLVFTMGAGDIWKVRELLPKKNK